MRSTSTYLIPGMRILCAVGDSHIINIIIHSENRTFQMLLNVLWVCDVHSNAHRTKHFSFYFILRHSYSKKIEVTSILPFFCCRVAYGFLFFRSFCCCRVCMKIRYRTYTAEHRWKKKKNQGMAKVAQPPEVVEESYTDEAQERFPLFYCVLCWCVRSWEVLLSQIKCIKSKTCISSELLSRLWPSNLFTCSLCSLVCDTNFI